MAPSGTSGTQQLSSPRLVARGHERELLLRAVTGTDPAVVLVEGEGGVGKTRLVAEVLAAPELVAHRRLVGVCRPLREPFPLAPLLDAVRAASWPPPPLPAVTGALRALLPERAGHLPPALPPLAEPRAERHRVLRAVRELLAVLAPAVIVVEDAHWADESTLELLGLLLGEPPPGLAVVVTSRPEERDGSARLAGLVAHTPRGAAVLRLAVGPLDVAGVAALVGAILETEDVSPEFASYLRDRTAGLPFAVEEVLRLLQDRRELVRRDGRWARRALDRLGVPPAMRDALRARVERLDADARSVVECVGAVGRAADDDLVAAVAGWPLQRTRDALTAAVRDGILVDGDDGVTDFRHALARQAVHDDLPGPRRRALHLAAASALARLPAPPVAELAHHHALAGCWERAAADAEAAADVAAAHGDDVAVCRFLQAALAAPRLARDTRVRLARRLGHAALHAFDHAEAAAVLRRVLDAEPLDRADRGELRRHLGILLVQAGDASAGVAELARAVDDLADRPARAVTTMLSLAAPWVVEGDMAEHRGWLARAAAVDLGDCSPVDRIAALVDRATALASLGDPSTYEAEARIPADTGTDATRRVLQRGCLNLAQTALYVGDAGRAAAWLRRFEVLAAGTPSALFDGLHRTTTVLLDWHVGRWDGLAERAAALCEEMADVPHAAVDVCAVAGLLGLARGDASATERLVALLPVARRAGSLPVLALVAGGLGAWHLAADRPAAAVAVCGPVVDLLARKGTWGWAGDVAPVLADALVAAGDAAAAQDLVNRLVAGAPAVAAPALAPAVAACRGAVLAGAGAPAEAASAYGQAEAGWAALPRPVLAARAGVARGCCMLAAGDGSGGAAGLAALERLRPLGADGEAAAGRRRLRAAGATVPYRWRGGRQGYGEALSPREREVVVLVAEGLTNREAAAALYLSVRTVEQHVATAMRKLVVSSRRELRLPAEPVGPTDHNGDAAAHAAAGAPRRLAVPL